MKQIKTLKNKALEQQQKLVEPEKTEALDPIKLETITCELLQKFGKIEQVETNMLFCRSAILKKN